MRKFTQENIERTKQESRNFAFKFGKKLSAKQRKELDKAIEAVIAKNNYDIDSCIESCVENCRDLRNKIFNVMNAAKNLLELLDTPDSLNESIDLVNDSLYGVIGNVVIMASIYYATADDSHDKKSHRGKIS